MSKDSSQDLWGSAETKYFYEITPDKILQAVESFGFRCTGRTLALNSLENRVYDVEIEAENPQSRSDTFKVIKFYRPNRWSREQILEEHQFLEDLDAQELPVVLPLKNEQGESLVTDVDTGIHFSVFPKYGGRILDEFSSQQIAVIGRLLARLHNVGATASMRHRLELSADTYGYENADYLEESPYLLDNFKSRYLDLVDSICEISEPWFEEVSYQRIHGDCHLGNILWRDDDLTIVDFDDSLRGPCVQDIWLLVPGRDDESKRQLDELLAAYEEFRDFDYGSLRLIEALRSLRMVHFNAWIAHRWEDPAFKKIFPEYGTERYWSEQIAGLHEQLEILNGSVSI